MKREPRSPRTKTGRKLEKTRSEELWRERKKQFPVNPASGGKPAAGKRTADALSKLFLLTGDPVFHEASRALQAYGLDGPEPVRSAKRFWEANTPEYTHATLIVFSKITEARANDRRLSVRVAVEQTVAMLGIPRSSLDAAATHLEKGYRRGLKDGFPMPPENAGFVGTTLHVMPVDTADDLYSLGAGGAEVPNNRQWRQRVFAGAVYVRFMGKEDDST